MLRFFTNGIKNMENRREELLNRLRSTGAIHRLERGENLWREAFELYREAKGEHLSMKCSRCFQKVKEWLQNGR
jgi:hypothetical protein